MGLSICRNNGPLHEAGEYLLTTPDGEFLASWAEQKLSLALVSRMVNEAYKAGHSKGEAQLAQVKQLLKE